MSDTTETPQPPAPSAGTPRRRFFRRAALITAVAVLATGIGLKAFAYGHGFGGWHRGGLMGAHLDPAKLDEHLDRMLKHLYVEVDATDAQKQRLGPIVKARHPRPAADARSDAGRAAAGRQRSCRSRASTATALESLRASQLQLAEQASKRFTQALADVADVLTPEQRKQLAERVGRWHGHRG